MKSLTLLLVCLNLAACAPQKINTKPNAETNNTASRQVSSEIQHDCKISESANWHAWLDKGGEGRELRLLVTGEVTLPSPAHTVKWQRGPMDRAFPPSLRLRITAQAPRLSNQPFKC